MSLRPSLFQWGCSLTASNLSPFCAGLSDILSIIALCVAVSFVVSLVSGWHLLAQRFRADGPFEGRIYRWFQAGMRWSMHYGNSLKAGATSEGLYIAPVFLFRIAHPPLFIPWKQIRIGSSKWLGFWVIVTFTLGLEEQVPFRIGARLARKLRADTGDGWPDPQNLLQL